MDEPVDTNVAVWKSAEAVQEWTSSADERERKRAAHWRILAELLPFDVDAEFSFVDLGAGTGAASRTLLEFYPRSTAILADYSAQMMDEGKNAMARFAGRYRYVEFDMSSSEWPAAIPTSVDAVITSLCVHHLPDTRKAGLFAEIFDHLVAGGWYLNYDPLSSTDSLVEETWQRVNDRIDPGAAEKRAHRTPLEQARHENHVRYLVPLEQQLGYLRSAGFAGIDVYWKFLENVILGGRRPA